MRKRWILLALAVAAGGALAAGADYAREERWAQEIVPALVVGDAVELATRLRPRVLAILTEPAGAAKGGVVVVHGLGVHPDFGVAAALRTGLADAGWITLSVQMPVLAADAPGDAYDAVMPEAAERIAAALDWLRVKGVARRAIVAYSLGARMAMTQVMRPDAARIDAWVPIGLAGGFTGALRQPTLDVLSETELPAVAASAPERRPALPRDACSRQLVIPGSDHYFSAGAKALTAAVAAFLDRVIAGAC